MSLSDILRGSSSSGQKTQSKVITVKKAMATESSSVWGDQSQPKDTGFKTVQKTVKLAPIKAQPVKFNVTELKKITGGAALVPPTKSKKKIVLKRAPSN